MTLSLDVKKSFGTFKLSMKLEAGNEVIGLLGASGCGKSATLRSIAGLITPDEGHISVDGKVLFDSATGVNLKTRERRTAMLFQNYQLFPNMTVRQNVEAGLARGLSRAERHEKSDRLLAMFGLQGMGERYPARLSGGQQQRVALSRMLAAEPDILLFDEPFSALDSHLKSALEQSLLDMFDTVDHTILYVSHDIDEALRFSDRIVVMDAGHAVQVATGRELVDHPATLASIRLSGVKNTTAVQVTGEHSLRALDWGMDFRFSRPVPPDTKYMGIRASFIRQVPEGTQGDNIFRLHVHRVGDSRFERTVMLDTPGGDAANRIQWKVDLIPSYGEKDLPQTGEWLTLAFDAQNLYLVPR